MNSRGWAMIWFYLVAAVAIGALLPTQAAVNGRLRQWLGGPLSASMVSVLVSALTFGLLLMLIRPAPPAWSELERAPWWVWTGGVLGAAVVIASLVLVDRLGAAVAFTLIIFGQLLASLVLDHFGLLGVPQHQISPTRLLGVALVLAGVVLIRLR